MQIDAEGIWPNAAFAENLKFGTIKTICKLAWICLRQYFLNKPKYFLAAFSYKCFVSSNQNFVQNFFLI